MIFDGYRPFSLSRDGNDGNAIVAIRFDTTEIGDVWTEICAYGTAVQTIPITDGAK